MVAVREIPLVGGMDPRYAPVRIGDTVHRPAGSSREGVRALLRHLEAVGFDGAPRHLGVDDEGREVVSFIEGEVPLPPYPAWAMTELALADLGRLLRDFHDATAGFVAPRDAEWATDWADPAGAAGGAGEGHVICHNDVFPENVVFRDGRVVGLIDFAMAAPGRPLWDLAIAAELWCPLGDPTRRDNHPAGLDAINRFGVLARAYGLSPDRGAELVDVVVGERAHSGANIRAEIAAGNESWIHNWAAAGGDERAAIDDAWIAAHRRELIQAVRG
jgi:hypothetical protein